MVKVVRRLDEKANPPLPGFENAWAGRVLPAYEYAHETKVEPVSISAQTIAIKSLVESSKKILGIFQDSLTDVASEEIVAQKRASDVQKALYKGGLEAAMKVMEEPARSTYEQAAHKLFSRQVNVLETYLKMQCKNDDVVSDDNMFVAVKALRVLAVITTKAYKVNKMDVSDIYGDASNVLARTQAITRLDRADMNSDLLKARTNFTRENAPEKPLSKASDDYAGNIILGINSMCKITQQQRASGAHVRATAASREQGPRQP